MAKKTPKKAAAKAAPKRVAPSKNLAQARAMLAAARARTCAQERGAYAAYAVQAAIGAKATPDQKRRVIAPALKLATGCNERTVLSVQNQKLLRARAAVMSTKRK